MTNEKAIKTAKILLGIKAVSLSPNKPFKYTSGMLSPIYTDIRLVNSYPKERKILINFYTDIIKTKIGISNVDVVSGTATASIGMAAWIADLLDLPLIYVRPKKKEHGKGKQVEGVLKRKQKVIVIEDLISTGGSSLANAQACRQEEGAIVKNVIATLRYPTKTIDEAFRKMKVRLYVLCHFNTLIEVAHKSGYITKKEELIIKEWGKDTWGWAKKMGFSENL